MRHKLTVFLILIILVVPIFAGSVRFGTASTLDVGPGKPYSTIQSAIDAASVGDTIKVYPGTYNEQVTIYKQLDIVSVSGASQTIISAAGVAAISGGSFALVSINALGNVQFQGFTVQNVWNVAYDREGIVTHCNGASPTYTISDNIIYGTNNASDEQDYGFYAQFGQENLVFRNNTITQTGSNNMILETHTGKAEISSNILDAGVYGVDSIFFMTYNGIIVDTMQNVSHNTFNMGTGGPFDYDHRATAISFCTPGAAYGLDDASFTNVVIQGNTISNLNSYRRGIGFWNGGGEEGGIVAPIVENNIITGINGSIGSYGVDFIGMNAAINATITYNTITETEVGVDLRTADCAPGVKINYNNIFDNNVGLDNTFGPSIADARFNYWGSPGGPGGIGPGTGQQIAGSAVFDPWLSSYQLPVWTQVLTDPPLVEKFVSNNGVHFGYFNVSINIQNVTDLFGFEFNVTWDNSLLNLISVEYTPELNQIWGSNSNWTKIQNTTQNGWYDLVALALAPTRGYTSSGNATLAKLTFRVAVVPCYIAPDYQLQTRFHFSTIKLSDSDAQSIGAFVNDGQYVIHAAPPILKIVPISITCSKLNQRTTVQIAVIHALDVSAIDFTFKYNTTLLKAQTFQWLDLSGFLPGPYIDKTTTVDEVNGLIHFIIVENLTAGAPLASGDSLLINVTFTAIEAMIWKNATGWANCMGDFMTFTDWNITVHCPGMHSLTGNLVTVIGGNYSFVPIKGDVDSNGKVDIMDLAPISTLYGISSSDPGYDATYDLNNDGVIDIFDLVTIGANWGYKYDP